MIWLTGRPLKQLYPSSLKASVNSKPVLRQALAAGGKGRLDKWSSSDASQTAGDKLSLSNWCYCKMSQKDAAVITSNSWKISTFCKNVMPYQPKILYSWTCGFRGTMFIQVNINTDTHSIQIHNQFLEHPEKQTTGRNLAFNYCTITKNINKLNNYHWGSRLGVEAPIQ